MSSSTLAQAAPLMPTVPSVEPAVAPMPDRDDARETTGPVPAKAALDAAKSAATTAPEATGTSNTPPVDAFAAFLGQTAARRRSSQRTRLTVIVSLALHAVAGVGAWARSVWHVEELSAPTLGVHLVFAPPAPSTTPPAPGPIAKAAPARTPPAPNAAPKRALTQPTEAAPTATPEPAPEAAPAAVATAAPASDEGGGGSSEGTATGPAGGGSATGVAGGAIGAVAPPAPPQPSPELRRAQHARYLAQVRQRVLAVFRYPPQAASEELEGKVVVQLRVDASGRLLSAHATQCPHPILCSAALDTVRAACPLPAPPPELGGNVPLELPLAYTLE